MKPYFYTFNRQRGMPTVKHESLQIAQSEAERLAAKHPGEVFEILRCVGIAQTSKASTFWMDGEEPPETVGYRMLEKGDLIEVGDEYDHYGTRRHRYFSIVDKINSDHRPTRRPL